MQFEVSFVQLVRGVVVVGQFVLIGIHAYILLRTRSIRRYADDRAIVFIRIAYGSNLCFVILATYCIAHRFVENAPFVWQTPVAAIGSTCGIIAFLEITRREK